MDGSDAEAIRQLRHAGEAAYRAGRMADAAALFTRAAALAPADAGLHHGRAVSLHLAGRLGDAVAAYREALALDPSQAASRHGLGLALASAGDLSGAVHAYCAAIRLDPGHGSSYVGLGIVLQRLGRFEEAREAFERGLAATPDDPQPLANLIHLKQYVCDWDGLDALERRLLDAVDRGQGGIAPFILLGLPSTRAQQLAAARRTSAAMAARAAALPAAPAVPRAGRRLRLGYLSADFHQHATGCLTAELFEAHDRAVLEVFAYSYGPDDGSALRRRLVAAFEHFVDVAALDHGAIARRIRDDGIDVLIDLKGHTTDSRFALLAQRPAPVQIAWLGYPGTTGADFVDYVIADPYVLPARHEPDFSERVLRLPGCYQPNDSRREIARDTPSRQVCGLPADGFVFCCFNNSFKIRPDLFARWMALLSAVPGSVLWLLDGNAAASRNLRAAATRSGVSPDRLVFAPRLPPDRHLARHRHADLFLDTAPYNAHTTASDALWAGVPVLTMAGETFAGRVAGSLLAALGLDDLITGSPAAYEAKARQLATEPDALAAVRDRLAHAIAAHDVFDGRAFARTLERTIEALVVAGTRQG